MNIEEMKVEMQSEINRSNSAISSLRKDIEASTSILSRRRKEVGIINKEIKDHELAVERYLGLIDSLERPNSSYQFFIQTINRLEKKIITSGG